MNLSIRTLHSQSEFSWRQKTWGLIFLSPWIAGLLIFTLLPMLFSLIFTFTRFELNHPETIQFIGLQNYGHLLSDPLVRDALVNMVRFGALALPVSLGAPILLAALMNAKRLWGKRLFRTLFYVPTMVPVISVVYIWNGFLNPQTGWLNRFLLQLGVNAPDWLNSVDWIYSALVIMGLWGTGSAMLITLASMQSVPTELYEAAKVDGANGITRFSRITLPMISPVIFYNLVLTVIGIFRYFDLPYVLSRGTGQPNNATYFFNVHLYKTAFVFQDMGYGSTLAWLLFVMALGVTLILFTTANRWVYYAGGER